MDKRISLKQTVGDLTDEDKKNLEAILKKLSVRGVAALMETTSKKPEALQIFIDSYKEKLTALEAGDEERIKQIADKEIKMLEDMEMEKDNE